MENIAVFMYDTQMEMEAAGVEVILDHDHSHVKLPTGLECNGYFIDYPKAIFACATKKDFNEWFPVYVHEYCHFTQWRDEIPEWDALWRMGLYYDNFLDQWIERGLEFRSWTIRHYIQAGINIEADCERRVIELINEYDFPIDPEEYAQKANAYVHFYNYVEENRTWYIAGKEPYNVKEVWSQFNTTIDDDFSLNPGYMALYEKYCF